MHDCLAALGDTLCVVPLIMGRTIFEEERCRLEVLVLF
jgi:hypothetical protein